jgi:hypothetical protein
MAKRPSKATAAKAASQKAKTAAQPDSKPAATPASKKKSDQAIRTTGVFVKSATVPIMPIDLIEDQTEKAAAGQGDLKHLSELTAALRKDAEALIDHDDIGRLAGGSNWIGARLFEVLRSDDPDLIKAVTNLDDTGRMDTLNQALAQGEIDAFRVFVTDKSTIARKTVFLFPVNGEKPGSFVIIHELRRENGGYVGVEGLGREAKVSEVLDLEKLLLAKPKGPASPEEASLSTTKSARISGIPNWIDFGNVYNNYDFSQLTGDDDIQWETDAEEMFSNVLALDPCLVHCLPQSAIREGIITATDLAVSVINVIRAFHQREMEALKEKDNKALANESFLGRLQDAAAVLYYCFAHSKGWLHPVRPIHFQALDESDASNDVVLNTILRPLEVFLKDLDERDAQDSDEDEGMEDASSENVEEIQHDDQVEAAGRGSPSPADEIQKRVQALEKSLKITPPASASAIERATVVVNKILDLRATRDSNDLAQGTVYSSSQKSKTQQADDILQYILSDRTLRNISQLRDLDIDQGDRQRVESVTNDWTTLSSFSFSASRADKNEPSSPKKQRVTIAGVGETSRPDPLNILDGNRRRKQSPQPQAPRPKHRNQHTDPSPQPGGATELVRVFGPLIHSLTGVLESQQQLQLEKRSKGKLGGSRFNEEVKKGFMVLQSVDQPQVPIDLQDNITAFEFDSNLLKSILSKPSIEAAYSFLRNVMENDPKYKGVITEAGFFHILNVGLKAPDFETQLGGLSALYIVPKNFKPTTMTKAEYRQQIKQSLTGVSEADEARVNNIVDLRPHCTDHISDLRDQVDTIATLIDALSTNEPGKHTVGSQGYRYFLAALDDLTTKVALLRKYAEDPVTVGASYVFTLDRTFQRFLVQVMASIYSQPNERGIQQALARGLDKFQRNEIADLVRTVHGGYVTTLPTAVWLKTAVKAAKATTGATGSGAIDSVKGSENASGPEPAQKTASQKDPKRVIRECIDSTGADMRKPSWCLPPKAAFKEVFKTPEDKKDWPKVTDIYQPNRRAQELCLVFQTTGKCTIPRCGRSHQFYKNIHSQDVQTIDDRIKSIYKKYNANK